jgi:hypothetical protein
MKKYIIYFLLITCLTPLVAGQKPDAIPGIQTLCLEVEEVYPEIEGNFTIHMEGKIRKFLTSMGLQVLPFGETCDASLKVLLTGHAFKEGYSYESGKSQSCYGSASYMIEMKFRRSGAKSDKKFRRRSTCTFRTVPEEECSQDQKKAPFDLAWQVAFLFGLEKFFPPNNVYLAALVSPDDRQLRFQGFRFFVVRKKSIPQALPDIIQMYESAVIQKEQIVNTAREAASSFDNKIILLNGSIMLGKLDHADMDGVPYLVNALRKAVANDESYRGFVDALKKITRQDFGNDPDVWQQWWNENKDKFIKKKSSKRKK